MYVLLAKLQTVVLNGLSTALCNRTYLFVLLFERSLISGRTGILRVLSFALDMTTERVSIDQKQLRSLSIHAHSTKFNAKKENALLDFFILKECPHR